MWKLNPSMNSQSIFVNIPRCVACPLEQFYVYMFCFVWGGCKFASFFLTTVCSVMAQEAFPLAQRCKTFELVKIKNVIISFVQGKKIGSVFLSNFAWLLKNRTLPPLISWLLMFICMSLLGVMGEYEPKIEVQFPEFVHVAKGSTIKLECFALGK